jgi:hypothetical protein
MRSKKLADFAVEIEKQNLEPKDFLYNRLGPWPQPSANHPIGEVPGVLHLPFSETFMWWLKVGSRYVRDMFLYFPVAFCRAVFQNGLHELSDEKMSDIIFNTCYAKYLCAEISDDLKRLFKDYMVEGKTYYIIDFSAMELCQPLEGLHAEKSISLFEKTEKSVKPVAINLRNYVVDAKDGDLWKLAKFTVMQGASVFINVVEHPKLHFPMDPINAITKTAVPKNHLLFKLIYPHLEISLKLNYQVLNNPISLLVQKDWMDYAPFPATSETLRELVVVGYSGIPGNPAYNKYEYPMNGPRVCHSDFGKFHQQYYPAYYNLAKDVLSKLPRNDMFVTRWADYINSFMPSFPNGKTIWEGDNLYRAVGVLIWDLTIGHGCDHYTYSQIPVYYNPMRLRVGSPVTKDANFKFDHKKAVTWMDQTKWMMASHLFYEAWNIKDMMEIDYKFNDNELNAAVEKFRADMKKIEANLTTPNYMPVDIIPSSIQY